MDLNLIVLILLAGLSLFFALGAYYIYRRQPSLPKTEGDYFDSHRGPIFYKVHGHKKPAILLVHGLGASHYCWRHVVRFLESHYQVVTVDLWGFGSSNKNNVSKMNLDDQIKILIDLMDHLQVKQFHIIGHSMGGHITLWLARNHLDRIKKVVAIAPASHPKVAPKSLRRMAWVANLTPWIISRGFIRKVLQRVIVDRSLITDEVIDNYYAPYKDPDTHLSFAAAISMIHDERVFEELPLIEKPVLLLRGKRDHVISQKTIVKIHERLPQSQLETSPRSNHMPMEDDVEWLEKQILTFLKS